MHNEHKNTSTNDVGIWTNVTEYLQSYHLQYTHVPISAHILQAAQMKCSQAGALLVCINKFYDYSLPYVVPIRFVYWVTG